MILFAAASLVLVACNGDKKPATEGETPETEATTPQTEETTAPETSEATEGDALSKYEAIVDKLIPLMEKVKKGDASVASEYQKLSEEMAAIAPELQKELTNMTPEQSKRYQEIAEKWAKAAQ